MTDNLSDEIRHNLDLLLSDDSLIAFFAVMIFDKSIDITNHGDEHKVIVKRIVPFFYECVGDGFAADEKYELARSIIELGKKMEREALEKINN